MNLILCGHKSCGKTSLAHYYADHYGCEFIDTDQLITKAYHKTHGQIATPHQIYSKHGSDYFRKLEADSLEKLRSAENAVIALGGSTLVYPQNLKLIRSIGTIIYLDVESEIIRERIKSINPPPAFLNPENFEHDLTNYLTQRRALFKSVADYTFEASRKTVEGLATEINEIRESYVT